jgi:plasmid replication initiation protein
VHKHGGRQEGGWSFDLSHLHAKSGSLSPLKHVAYDLRVIVRRQTLPGYRLLIERSLRGDQLCGTTRSARSAAEAPAARRLSRRTLQVSRLGNSPTKEELHERSHACRAVVA